MAHQFNGVYVDGSLTVGERKQIERQAKIGGGISRIQTFKLLEHIDTIQQLLDEVLENGPEWDDEQWSVFINACLPLIDGWSVRLSKKLIR